MGAFAAKFNCPLVGITSLGAPIPSLDTVGNPSHPIFSPDHNLPLKRNLSFKERLMSALYAVYVRVHYQWVVLPREDRSVKKYFGKDMPYLGDIERNISILLLNRNPVFHRVMPLVPAVIELGSVRAHQKPQPLNEITSVIFVIDNLIQTDCNKKKIYACRQIKGNIPFNTTQMMSGDKSENTLQKILNEVIASKNYLKTYIAASEAKLLSEIQSLKSKIVNLEKKNSDLKIQMEKNDRNSNKKNIIIFGLEKPFEVTPAFICKEIRRLLQVELKESDISDSNQLGKKKNCPIKVEFISYFKKKEVGILRQLESSEGTTLGDTPHLAKKEKNAWNEDSSSEEEISDSKSEDAVFVENNKIAPQKSSETLEINKLPKYAKPITHKQVTAGTTVTKIMKLRKDSAVN
ncbi:hypothetical protein WA026_020733 [Henosepilachna vigintioctopunctata]|uniref:Uncharacterized protein n=1 Tax=Henosepilachna vigintioctopunctata TaxID=420089 RepID=A0AAW1UBP0_9CUCU